MRIWRFSSLKSTLCTNMRTPEVARHVSVWIIRTNAHCKSYLKNQYGSVPVEYGMLALLLAAFLVAIWGQTGDSLGEMYENRIGASMNNAIQGALK